MDKEDTVTVEEQTQIKAIRTSNDRTVLYEVRRRKVRDYSVERRERPVEGKGAAGRER